MTPTTLFILAATCSLAVPVALFLVLWRRDTRRLAADNQASEARERDATSRLAAAEARLAAAEQALSAEKELRQPNQGQVQALTAQRTRLQELQATAENLSDLLEIESSLSDVQYQLESWQSQLNWYSQQVECSTVYLSLSEVKEYTPTEESYLSQLSSALRNGRSGFVSGLQQLTVWVVGVWPLLTLMAAAALIVHLVRRRTRK